MRSWRRLLCLAAIVVAAVAAPRTPAAFAAYHHMGESDSAIFLTAHPEAAGSKLDACALCHTGGSRMMQGRTVSVGSCQWCHETYGYDGKGDISGTLNPYGRDYLQHGRSAEAVAAIEATDSDGDGYSNGEEIAAGRYPGDPSDDPEKVEAPYRVYRLEDIERMPQHTQFLMMNAHKSTDYYAEYSGVPLEVLLKPIALPDATGITVYSPDGFSQYHPFEPSPGYYHINGPYPDADFHYNEHADVAKHPDPQQPDYGWCDYSAPSVGIRKDGDPIVNPAGQRLLLAIKRDGQYLEPGRLNDQNKLDGEGPFRVVPPQLVPGYPDQRSTAKNQMVVWPFDEQADHNAGYSTRTATMIRVEPLPPGFTDINTLEAGWGYVEEGKIVVYGAIDPVPTVLEKLDRVSSMVALADPGDFGRAGGRDSLLERLRAVRESVASGKASQARRLILFGLVEDLEAEARDGSAQGPTVGRSVYWGLREIAALLGIVER